MPPPGTDQAIGSAEMPQQDEETRPHDSANEPAPLRPSADAWASLSATEDDDDLSGAVAMLPPQDEIEDQDAGDAEAIADAVDPDEADPTNDFIESPAAIEEDEHDAVETDDAAHVAADANVAAVEAAMEAASVQATAAASVAANPPSRGGMFTIPLLCAGIAIIAACLLIPQADANRRLVYERMKLQADLEAVEKQVATNEEFLNKVADDPNLAERLAQRQMKIIRKGSEVLTLKTDVKEEMSPFQLTAVPPAEALPPYQPRGGALANLCYNPKSRLYLMGIGLMATAAGLVLGFGPRSDQ